jgi:hypothetical protein
MIVSSLKDHTNGWFIGDFMPSMLKTSAFEVAVHFYTTKTECFKHMHKIATEYNCIISGSLVASGRTLGKGTIFVYEPGETSDVTFLEDTTLVIVKTPSLPSDKYKVE